jgi:hypothetical protein
MIIYNPVVGDIEVPDTKEAIEKELFKVSKRLSRRYSKWQQAYYDALSEGLDMFRR